MMVQSLVLVWNSAVQERFNINFSVNFFASVGGFWFGGGSLGTGLWVLVLFGAWALGYGSMGFWDLLDIRSYCE